MNNAIDTLTLGQRPDGRTLITASWVVGHKDGNHTLLRNGEVVFDNGEIVEASFDARGDIHFGKAAMPLRGFRRGPHRLGGEQFATIHDGASEDLDRTALQSEQFKKTVQRILWMARQRVLRETPLRVAHAADGAPGLIVEIGVEAGQHHRASRMLRDGAQEFRGRWHRAGRTCCDGGAGQCRDRAQVALGRCRVELVRSRQ